MIFFRAAVSLLFCLFFLSGGIANADETNETNQNVLIFEKFGFSLKLPEGSNPRCLQKYIRSASEAKATDGEYPYEYFCKSDGGPTQPAVYVGWKEWSLSNTTFVNRVIGDTGKDALNLQGRWTSKCENRTDIAEAVGKYSFPTRAASCVISSENYQPYTVIVFFFYTKKEEGTQNFVFITDIKYPGTATNEKIIEIVKGLNFK